MGKPPPWLLTTAIILGLACGASGRRQHHGLHMHGLVHTRLLAEPSPANTSATSVFDTLVTWLAPARALSDAADCVTLDCQIDRGVCLPRLLEEPKRCVGRGSRLEPYLLQVPACSRKPRLHRRQPVCRVPAAVVLQHCHRAAMGHRHRLCALGPVALLLHVHRRRGISRAGCPGLSTSTTVFSHTFSAVYGQCNAAAE